MKVLRSKVRGVYEPNRAWLLFSDYMITEPQTRHSLSLPELRFSLNLLYVGRLLLGMQSSSLITNEGIDAFDERIENITDELVATELLHEAAVLAGDILPENKPAGDPNNVV